jgi:hypothetical protein
MEVVILIISLLILILVVSSSMVITKIYEKLREISEIQLSEIEYRQKNRGLLDVPETSQIPYNLTSRK